MAERRKFLEHGFGRVVRTGGRIVSDLVGYADVHRIPSARQRHEAGINKLEATILHFAMPGLTKALSYHHDPHENLFKGIMGIVGGTILDVAAYAAIPLTGGWSLVAERGLISGGSGVIREVRFGGPQGIRRGVPRS